MRRLEQTNSSSITHLFIYALAFLLLWEWLRPIPTITDTSYIEVFVFFAFFSCVLIFFKGFSVFNDTFSFIGKHLRFTLHFS
ncbi:MAG: hypothetical protein LRY73_16210 [Bacillus sp. (in: Bacteria)]|nr:hypothetical protein [Bacillus sp. (in: firmicutes)]